MGTNRKNDLSRRSFLRKMGTASAATAGVPFLGSSLHSNIKQLNRKDFLSVSNSANDKINIALIGAGLMGQGDLNTAMSKRPGYTISNFSEATQEDFLKMYEERYPGQRASVIEPHEFIYRAPDGYNDRYDHFGFFFDAVRNGTLFTQNSTFACVRAARHFSRILATEKTKWLNGILKQWRLPDAGGIFCLA